MESDCSLKTKEGLDNEIHCQADIAVDDSNLFSNKILLKWSL